MKFPDTNDIRYRCNDIDECRKSNDVEQERIARVNLVIMMTDIDEKTFKALNQLEQAIVDYIDYYNNKRIKVKLKGLSPVQYRLGSVQSDAMRFLNLRFLPQSLLVFNTVNKIHNSLI